MVDERVFETLGDRMGEILELLLWQGQGRNDFVVDRIPMKPLTPSSFMQSRTMLKPLRYAPSTNEVCAPLRMRTLRFL